MLAGPCLPESFHSWPAAPGVQPPTPGVARLPSLPCGFHKPHLAGSKHKAMPGRFQSSGTGGMRQAWLGSQAPLAAAGPGHSPGVQVQHAEHLISHGTGAPTLGLGSVLLRLWACSAAGSCVQRTPLGPCQPGCPGAHLERQQPQAGEAKTPVHERHLSPRWAEGLV